MLAVALSSGNKYELNWEAVRVRATDSELALGRRITQRYFFLKDVRKMDFIGLLTKT